MVDPLRAGLDGGDAHVREAVEVLVGEQVGEKLFVRLRQGFGDQQATEFVLEYQIKDYLRMQGTVAETADTQRTTFRRIERGGLDLHIQRVGGGPARRADCGDLHAGEWVDVPVRSDDGQLQCDRRAWQPGQRLVHGDRDRYHRSRRHGAGGCDG